MITPTTHVIMDGSLAQTNYEKAIFGDIVVTNGRLSVDGAVLENIISCRHLSDELTDHFLCGRPLVQALQDSRSVLKKC